MYNWVFFTCPPIKAKLMNYLSLTGKQFTCVWWCLTLWDSRCFYANEMIIKYMWSSHLDYQKLTYLSQKFSHVQKDNLKSWSPIWLGYCVVKWLCLWWWIIVFPQFVFWSLLQYLTVVTTKQNIDFSSIDNQQIILKLIRKKGIC